jgi:hypothetical protein
MPSWEEATAVEKLSSNTYSCTLHDDWCIGSGMTDPSINNIIHVN